MVWNFCDNWVQIIKISVFFELIYNKEDGLTKSWRTKLLHTIKYSLFSNLILSLESSKTFYLPSFSVNLRPFVVNYLPFLFLDSKNCLLFCFSNTAHAYPSIPKRIGSRPHYVEKIEQYKGKSTHMEPWK